MNIVQLDQWKSDRMRASARKPAAEPRPKKRLILTDQKMRDADLLKKAWNRVEMERKGRNQAHSKKHLAGIWSVNPSNVSQYVNGHIPLNTEAKLRFAQYLELSPAAIWPDFQFSTGELPPEAVEVAREYLNLDESMKAMARNLLKSLPKQPRR